VAAVATITSLGFSIFSRYRGDGTREAADDIQSLDSKLKSTGRSIQDTGRTLTTHVTTPILAVGITALKMSGDFEAAMQGVKAVTGATGTDFDQLRQKAKDLGSTTAFSASEAAAGMEFLGMAGWDTNQILTGMPDILNLAAAGNVGLADAANTASNIMAGFGIEAEDSAKVADALAAACASANVDLSMLGETMKVAAPAAASAGWSLEQTAAAAGMLGNAGIQGETAGSGLTQALLGMMDAASPASKALSELGVSALDSSGNVRDMSAILRDLEAAGANAVDMGRIFGADHGPKMAALLGQGSEALEKLETDLMDVEGAAKTMGDIRLEGLNGEITQLGSAFEGLMIEIGEAGLLDIVTRLVSKVTDFVQGLSRTNPEVLKWATVIAAVIAVAGPLLIFVGMLITAIGALGTALAFLAANPVVLIVAAIVALIAVVVYVATQTTIFQDTWNWVWGKVLAVASWAVERIRAAWANIRKYLIDPVLSAYSWVTTKIDALVTYARRLPGRISSAVSGMWDGMKSAFRSAINWIISKWNSLSFTLPSVRVPGIGTIGGATIHTPNIPFLAHGGVIDRAGMAVVGEAGPELVHLSRGAQVTPLTGGGGGRGAPVEVVIRLEGDEDLIRMFRKGIRVRGGNVQAVLGEG
jgi:TP901 family phage tail tape measure protein